MRSEEAGKLARDSSRSLLQPIEKTARQKKTAIRRIREIGVSRRHGDLIEGPTETPRTSQHYSIERFKGGLQLGSHYAERRQFLGKQIGVFFAMMVIACAALTEKSFRNLIK